MIIFHYKNLDYLFQNKKSKTKAITYSPKQ